MAKKLKQESLTKIRESAKIKEEEDNMLRKISVSISERGTRATLHTDGKQSVSGDAIRMPSGEVIPIKSIGGAVKVANLIKSGGKLITTKPPKQPVRDLKPHKPLITPPKPPTKQRTVKPHFGRPPKPPKPPEPPKVQDWIDRITGKQPTVSPPPPEDYQPRVSPHPPEHYIEGKKVTPSLPVMPVTYTTEPITTATKAQTNLKKALPFIIGGVGLLLLPQLIKLIKKENKGGK